LDILIDMYVCYRTEHPIDVARSEYSIQSTIQSADYLALVIHK